MKHSQLTKQSCADLFHQLALLMRSGVDLSDGIALLAEDESDPLIRQLLQDSTARLDAGASLAETLRCAGLFPTYVTGLMQIGERVGRTEETLMALSRFYEEEDRMDRLLRNAVTYPLILLVMMFVIITILLTKVLPIFDDIYASLGGTLDGIAGILLSFGNFLNASMPILAAIMLAVVAGIAVYAVFPAVRKASGVLYNRFFGDGGISRRINDARFAQAFSMGMSSGLPLEECMTLCAELLADVPKASARCVACRAYFEEGMDIAAAFAKTEMIPPSACRMLLLGVRAGIGDKTMEGIANRLSEEAADALKLKVSKIEPALVLITSLLVGAILLCVMLPLMNIMKAIG